jgi:hypothetical protein
VTSCDLPGTSRGLGPPRDTIINFMTMIIIIVVIVSIINNKIITMFATRMLHSSMAAIPNP